MSQRRFRVIAFACMCIRPAVAGAEGSFAGGSIGWAEADVATNTPFVSISSDTLALVKGFCGYRVNDYLAVEGSLVGASNDEDNRQELTFSAITGARLALSRSARRARYSAKAEFISAKAKLEQILLTTKAGSWSGLAHL